MKKQTIKISMQALLLVSSLSLGMSINHAYAVEENTAKAMIVTLSNPTENYDISIGDQLTRSFVINVPTPYEMTKKAFPRKGSRDKGVQLVDIKFGVEKQKTANIYTITTVYQPFVNHSTPTQMQIPKRIITLTGGEKPLTVTIPAWQFNFSPLATSTIETVKERLLPEIKPPLLDEKTVQNRLYAFLTLAGFSLLGLLYMNADGRWLPFMGGAFAKAHRQLKRLANRKVVKTQREEKQGLVYIHEAFNAHYGANMFARDIESLITDKSAFSKMKTEIEGFFDYSNKSLYVVDKHDSEQVIKQLVVLSKQLRDCERGV